jgi:hypothetical protein
VNFPTQNQENIEMKKFVGIGALVAVVVSIAGLSFAEVGEYLQVARDRAASTVKDSIPLDVEIDRMQVLIRKLDQQVDHQKYAVARSEIVLQDAQAEYVRSDARCQHLLAEMDAEVDAILGQQVATNLRSSR